MDRLRFFPSFIGSFRVFPEVDRAACHSRRRGSATFQGVPFVSPGGSARLLLLPSLQIVDLTGSRHLERSCRSLKKHHFFQHRLGRGVSKSSNMIKHRLARGLSRSTPCKSIIFSCIDLLGGRPSRALHRLAWGVSKSTPGILMLFSRGRSRSTRYRRLRTSWGSAQEQTLPGTSK